MESFDGRALSHDSVAQLLAKLADSAEMEHLRTELEAEAARLDTDG